ncbi:MAG: peptidoglycan DD-metalloendopeptidase family protein, partial [Myxococcales bacterium]|nr:peptidoglycan DD-metalloendopeptidase family protein [Myxococcales bacterium]
YLENRLADAAFTEERIGLLRLLIGQVASALENARLYDELRTNEVRWRSLVNQLPDTVIIADAPDRLHFATGEPGAETLGNDENGLELADAIARVFAGQDFERIELQLALAGLERRWYALRMAPIVIDGVVERVIVVCTDIEERKQAETARARLEGQLRLETRLNEGRTLRLALLELGVDVVAIDEAEAAIRDTMDLGLLTGSGAPVRIAGDRDGGLQALEIEVAEGHLVQACRDSAGLQVRNIQHPLRVDVAVIALELGEHASLLEAALEAGQTPELARLVSETLAGELDIVTDLRPGDRLQVLAEKRYLGRNFHRYGKVLAVRYLGNGGRMAFYRYKPAGADEAFFDGDGKPMTRALLRSPFAWHPFDAEGRAAMVPAIEFVDGRMGAVYRRPLGAPVVAMGSGTVRRVGPEGDDGLVIEIELDPIATGDVDEQGEPLSTQPRLRYAHLLRTVGELAPGDRVEQGQVVALVGQSGKTPVSRLRLELIDERGERLDPMNLGGLGESGRAPRIGDEVAKEQLEQFEADIASWRRAMRKAGD